MNKSNLIQTGSRVADAPTPSAPSQPTDKPQPKSKKAQSEPASTGAADRS